VLCEIWGSHGCTSTLNMEATDSSKTLANIFHTSWHNIPKDSNLQNCVFGCWPFVCLRCCYMTGNDYTFPALSKYYSWPLLPCTPYSLYFPFFTCTKVTSSYSCYALYSHFNPSTMLQVLRALYIKVWLMQTHGNELDL
jgi:hypothetical protein